MFSLKKYYIGIIVFIFVLSIILPLPALINKEKAVTVSATPSFEDTLTVAFSDQTIKSIARYDFLFGILCNLDPECDEEAYKAQAVASYTLIQYELDFDTEKSDSYDFSEGSLFFQDYLTADEQKEKLGKNFEDASKRINTALSSVYGEKLTVKNRPILALSHDISAGKTESSEIILGEEHSYLVPVQSVSDLLCADYQKTFSFTEDQIKEKLSSVSTDWPKEKSDWFGNPDNSSSGTVKSVRVGEGSAKGTELMEKLNLSSPCFDIEYDDGKFNFICRGKGLCVGLSRFGANYMAEHGCTYEEILKWYYTGVDITKTE